MTDPKSVVRAVDDTPSNPELMHAALINLAAGMERIGFTGYLDAISL